VRLFEVTSVLTFVAVGQPASIGFAGSGREVRNETEFIFADRVEDVIAEMLPGVLCIPMVPARAALGGEVKRRAADSMLSGDGS
jgi:hypothetical protein